ncbi:hypothetical protein BDP27DRAFT_1434225 [Rhodocollybia butyracea]|uniref:Uncharacterized protein n=1 Tax=Rhodocollybia butyracea TaxID=206335 RepID=A0A9P5TX32_9AGAR|nr:hypothetical protein BDP27DRAFT_1434225 [Rhodocollybia butyracea]
MLNAQNSASSQKERSLQAAHKKMVQQLLSSKTGKGALVSANKLLQYKTAASFLVHSVHLFINQKLMFRYGLHREGLDLNTLEDNESDKENTDRTGGNPGDDEDKEEESIVNAIFAKQYQDFVKATPGLLDTMSRFKEDHCGLLLFVDLIHETLCTACSSDIKGFKSHIGKYILKDPNTDVLDPPVVNDGSKSNHGFAHPQFAPFLVPFDNYSEYTKGPTGFCALVLNKDARTDIKIDNSSGVLMLLYNMKLYNPEDHKAGWGRSFLLVQCLKHFINGPGSVFRDPESARALGGLTIQLMYKIKQLTPQLVAYVACMSPEVLRSDYIFLEEPDDWSKDIVDFLNNQVFTFNDDNGQESAKDGNITDPEEKESADKAAAELATAEKAAADLAAAEKAAAGVIEN